MKNDSPQNLNCKFAAETLEYLYGEIGGERRNAFKQHLNNCSDCADEIENLSDIRFSIQDWKAAEFDNLATPAILIPYETLKTVETEKSVSWVDSIRNYLTFSPVLSGAMVVLLIALFFGLGVFVFNNNENDLVAVSNQQPNLNAKPSEQPPVITKEDEPIKTPEVAVIDDEVIDEKPLIEKQSTQAPAQVISRTNTKQKIQTVKTTEKKMPHTDLKNDTKNAKTIPAKNKPRLNELPEEVEDNSLRLTDLFAELDTKE